MPRAMAGTARKSDGSLVSEVDCQANRLAGAVAKSAARALSTIHAVRCLRSVEDTMIHGVAVLRVIQCVANKQRGQTFAAYSSCTLARLDSVTAWRCRAQYAGVLRGQVRLYFWATCGSYRSRSA